MTVLEICALLSSFSFFVHVAHYFRSPHLKNELERYGMGKLGIFIIVLELLGAIGLLVGLVHAPFLTAASLGLGLLMLAALVVRAINKDSLLSALPAFFLMALNAFIAWASFTRLA